MYSRQIDVFKGLSMVMIVFSHNHLLVGNHSLNVQYYFYGFHITNFFLLSFMLNDKTFSFSHVKIQVNRLLKPMIVFMSISAVLYNMYADVAYDFITVIKMFSFHAAEIKHGFGFKSFWFPMAFFSFYILCMLFNSGNKLSRSVLVLSGVLLHIFYITIVDNNILLPGAMLIALYLVPVAVISKQYLSKYMSSHFNKGMIVPAVLFFVVLFLYKGHEINIGSFRFYSPFSDMDSYFISMAFIPLGFLMTWYMALFLKDNVFLVELGKLSYQVYFIHLFINFYLVTLIASVQIDKSLVVLLSFISSVITLYLSFLLSRMLMGNRVLSKIF